MRNGGEIEIMFLPFPLLYNSQTGRKYVWMKKCVKSIPEKWKNAMHRGGLRRDCKEIFHNGIENYFWTTSIHLSYKSWKPQGNSCVCNNTTIKIPNILKHLARKRLKIHPSSIARYIDRLLGCDESATLHEYWGSGKLENLILRSATADW